MSNPTMEILKIVVSFNNTPFNIFRKKFTNCKECSSFSILKTNYSRVVLYTDFEAGYHIPGYPRFSKSRIRISSSVQIPVLEKAGYQISSRITNFQKA